MFNSGNRRFKITFLVLEMTNELEICPLKKSKSTFFEIKLTYIGSILNDKNNLHTNVNYVTYANSDLFYLLFKLMTS